MDEAADPQIRRDAGDATSALGLHRLEGLLSLADEDADAVHHRFGALDRPSQGSVVTDVRLDRLDLADDAVGAHEEGLVGSPHGNPDAPTGPGKALHDVAADKARSADDRGEGGGVRHGSLLSGHAPREIKRSRSQNKRRAPDAAVSP
jgi:hypothetical protein